MFEITLETTCCTIATIVDNVFYHCIVNILFLVNILQQFTHVINFYGRPEVQNTKKKKRKKVQT